MAFLDPEPRAMLTAIAEMALIETGSPTAREHWQSAQLRNLLAHASQRSSFWQKRLGSKKLSDVKLGSLPVLTRQEVLHQVTSEGPLLRASDRLATQTHMTSGSSGIPVRFFVSEINGRYNIARSLAQFFMEGLDLSLNRTYLKRGPTHGFSVEKSQSWMGPLAELIKSGGNKHIEYLNPNIKKLVKELVKEDIGYLVCNPYLLETILNLADPAFFTQGKTRMWIAVGESVSQDLIKTFSDLAIPIRSNYSSEEVGPIGYECEIHSGHYHAATSNVIVEIVDTSYEIDGARLGKVLVTHLHSYATPFIRYDLGDLACLRQNCPCGHEGPTIYNLHGRLSRVLQHRDGRISPFHIRGQELAALADFAEYRMRQTEFTKIVIEIGGRSELSAEEIAALTTFLKAHAGPEFEIEVKACEQIDWGQSRKRHAFASDVISDRS
jgi:phenylacetate-coenzyme A ligase PaaK-like adenylate-forming protein